MIRCVLLLAALMCFGPGARGESDYTKWLNAKKAAEQSLANGYFPEAQATLEGVASIVPGIGQLAMTEHAYLLAEALTAEKKYPEALATVIAALDQIGPKPPGVRSQILQGLLLATKSAIYYRTKNDDNALAAAEQARNVLEMVSGKYHPHLYFLHYLIGTIQYRKANYAAAEESFKRALRTAEITQFRRRGLARTPEILGIEAMGVVGDAATDAALSLTDLCLKQERFKDALSYSKKATECAERTFGKKSSAVASTMHMACRVNLKMRDQKAFIANSDRLANLLSLYSDERIHFRPGITEPLWARFETEFYAPEKIVPEETLGKLVAVYGMQNFDFADLARRAKKIAVHDEVRLPKIQEAIRRQIHVKLPGSPDKLIAVESVFLGKDVKEMIDDPSPVSEPQFQP